MEQMALNWLLGALSLILSVACGILGWFAREIWGSVKKLSSDLSAFREQVIREYIRRDDFKEEIKEIKRMLELISNKLDNKQDKMA